MAAAKELSRYKLDLMGIQEVRWGRDGTKPTNQIIIMN
jgi:hypothetical protein